MPAKGKSKNAAKGKGRGRGRPVLRAPSPSAVSGSPEHEGQDTENDPAAQKTEPDAAEVHDPQDEGLFEAGGTEGPGQSNASSPSQSSVSSQKSTISKKPKKSCRLTDEQEEGQVLEWVQEHPCLWDKKNKDFKNRAMKDRLWDEKAKELGYDADSLKTWYTDLRDWNTKLHSQRSGDGQKEFTDRERWVMDRFMFLRSTIRHRRAPVKSVKEALAISKGDLDEAERIAAEDRIAIMDADEDPIEGQPTSSEPASSKPKKLKRTVDDPLLIEMRKKFDDAQSELLSVRKALAATEPTTERTAFLDWVRR